MDTRARDAALAQLRRLTLIAGIGAGALVAVFAGLAARAFPGRHAAGTYTSAPARRTVPAAGRRRAAPPPLVPVASGGSSASAPSAPPSTPSATSAPPVVVSGGS